MFRTFIACTALLLAMPFAAAAQDATKADEKELHSTYAKDRVKTCGVAGCVNFAKEFGLSLDYLGSIGNRIALARKAPDPVELALCSQALAVAEKVSGKQASITSEQVRAEAIDLAKQRGYANELSAVALIVPDAEVKRDLEKQLVLTKKRDEEALAAAKTGESTKELFGRLTVVNHSGECIRIFVSGRFYGEVHEGQTQAFHVHDHNPSTRLEAYCEEDGDLVSARSVFGHRHSFLWHIH